MAFFALVIALLDLIVAFEVLTAKRSIGYKLLWLLIIILLPIVGLLLYFLFGRAPE